MNLIDLNEGDVVVFRNGDERKVKRVYRYDCGLFDISFDKSVFGRSSKSITWNYRSDGKYDRDDLDEWANDIMKIIKKDVDTQIAAE
jgi:hypothetical protein